ncbi:unnamed protein product [Litomosoides sigmodontis]|uniref:Uncharacterized protein n=1 Tax=Litomosoides sigmodontis TaxID=42156 RepID=A0A3P6T9I7_LITSI|nr:unnamed protein product [Litomosoides sigmodontis]
MDSSRFSPPKAAQLVKTRESGALEVQRLGSEKRLVCYCNSGLSKFIVLPHSEDDTKQAPKTSIAAGKDQK